MEPGPVVHKEKLQGAKSGDDKQLQQIRNPIPQRNADQEKQEQNLEKTKNEELFNG